MDDDANVKTIIVILLGLALLIAFVGGCMAGIKVVFNLPEKSICSQLASIDESHQYVWNAWSGCLVEISGGFWVNYQNHASQWNDYILHTVNIESMILISTRGNNTNDNNAYHQ